MYKYTLYILPVAILAQGRKVQALKSAGATQGGGRTPSLPSSRILADVCSPRRSQCRFPSGHALEKPFRDPGTARTATIGHRSASRDPEGLGAAEGTTPEI